MAIDTECPSCGRTYRVKDELDGRKIRCKDCGEPFQIIDVNGVQEEVWDDEYEDDAYGAQGQYDDYAEPAPQPRRRKKTAGGGSGASKKSAARSSSAKPAWHLPVGLLGIVAGIGLTGFGIWAITQGKRKAGRATYAGIVVLIAAAKLAFAGDDE